MADKSLSVTKPAANRSSPRSDVVAGTSAPGAGDIELRINRTTNAITRKDVMNALKRFEDYLLDSANTDF
jgi:hypothetical protein